jgi:16S rRNA G527 N7-methylase RsmG
METKEQLKEDKSKLIDEILDLVSVIEKKDEHIEHLKKKLDLKNMTIENEDIDELFDRNS